MSVIKKLREEKRTNEEFEVMLKCLTLEEMFFLRLELEHETFENNLTGYRIHYIIRDVIAEGLVRLALDLKKTRSGAKRFLGINLQFLEGLMYKYKIPYNRRAKKKPSLTSAKN